MDRSELTDEILRICLPVRGVTIESARLALQALSYDELDKLCRELQGVEQRAKEYLAKARMMDLGSEL